MPRTAPTIDGTPSITRVSFRFVDSRGDMRAVSYDCTAPTNAEIEAVAVQYATLTNSNLWSVEVTQVYGIGIFADIADNAVFTSVDDIVGILVRNLADPRITERIELPAPLSTLVEDGEIVNTAPLANLVMAVRAMLSTALQWIPVQARFTERKDRNKAVRY